MKFPSSYATAIKTTSKCLCACALALPSVLILLQHKAISSTCSSIEPCTNQEILDLFHTIKQDLKVTLPIDLYVAKNTDFNGMFVTGLSTNHRIILDLDHINNNKIKLIHVIAHELGHALQYQQATGIPHFTLNNVVVSILLNSMPKTMHKHVKESALLKKTMQHFSHLEKSADTVSAQYQNCQDCLKSLQNDLKQNQHQHQKSLMGYFSVKDYQEHIDRSIQQNKRCLAHQKMHESTLTIQQLTNLNKRFTRSKPKAFHTMNSRTFKSKDFLPLSYNRDHYNFPVGNTYIHEQCITQEDFNQQFL